MSTTAETSVDGTQVPAAEEASAATGTDVKQDDEAPAEEPTPMQVESIAAAEKASTADGAPEDGSDEDAQPEPVDPRDKDFVSLEGIDRPGEFDVLNGRGASVNAHKGNQSFRSLCFQRKPEFDAGNHAVKRRIATEIVGVTKALPGRFLKRRDKQGPWYELTTEKAILKACQVMRDFQRPDRVALREMARLNAKKRQRTKPPSTPMPETPLPTTPLDPIVENPFGVHDHDVLSGRGAFVNGHVGNKRFRELAMERKAQFEQCNFSEKRALATEIVGIIRSLDPPGRFLKRVTKKKESAPKDEEEEGAAEAPRDLDDSWEELTDDKAIHKACQVMRDIDRPDRGPDRRQKNAGGGDNKDITGPEQAARDSITILAETSAAEAASASVEEAVAAAEAALDTVMDGVSAVPPPQAADDASKEKGQEAATKEDSTDATETRGEEKAAETFAI